MKPISKAYVVGDKSQMLGFKGAGFEVIHADDADSLARALGQLIRGNEASLVLVSEGVAAQIGAMDNFRENTTAIMSTIPTHEGGARLGFDAMRRMVERSVGVDLLGKE